MASEEKRSITIRINGKEVEASIKLVEKELAKARLSLKNATVGSKEYTDAMKRIQELSPIINKHKADLKEMSSAIKPTGIAGFASKLGALGPVFTTLAGTAAAAGRAMMAALGPIGLLIGGVAAIGSIVTGGVQSMREFEDAMKNLKIRTGITSEGINELKQSSIDLGARFGEAPAAIMQAFGEAASVRPELAKNTEELGKFTEQALILSKITGDDVTTSLQGLSTIMNTNGIATEDAAKTVNMLVGASQKGAKEVPFLAAAMEKVGGSAAAAGVGLGEQAAAIEVLGEKMTSSAETAGTGLRNILIVLQQEWQKTNDGPFDFQQALEQMAPSVNDINSLVNTFGKENAVAAQTLINNRDQVANLTTEIEGFNGAAALANDAQQTMSGQLDILGARWDGLWASMTDEDGILTQIFGGFNILIDVIGEAYEDAKEFFRSIFDAQDLAAEKSAAQQKKIAEGLENKLKSIANDGSLDEANAKLQQMSNHVATLDKNSAAYNENMAKVQRLTVLIEERKNLDQKREETALEAQAAAQKSQAEEQKKQAAERKRAAAEREREQLAEIARKRELLDLESDNIKLLSSRTFERGDFGQLEQKPLEELAPADIEQSKQDLVAAGLAKQRELYLSHQNDLSAIEKRFEEERFREKLTVAQEYYDILGQAAFTVIANSIDNRTRKEIAGLDEQRKAGLISEETYAKEREKIERAAFEKRKRLSYLEAIINGAVAVSKVYAQTGALGFAAVGPIIAQTVAQLAIIASQKYEKGGLVEGKSHAQGGVPIEVEGGEYVVRKSRVNAMTLPILRALNDGVFPMVNFGRRASTLRMERGGIAGGGEAPGIEMTGVIDAINNLSDRIATFEQNKQVVLSKDDRETFDSRYNRIQVIAAA